MNNMTLYVRKGFTGPSCGSIDKALIRFHIHCIDLSRFESSGRPCNPPLYVHHFTRWQSVQIHFAGDRSEFSINRFHYYRPRIFPS